MIITCEKCNTSFELDENLVKEAGSKVRCTNCDNVFIAKPQARSPKQEDSLDLSGLEMVLDMDAGKQKAPDLAPRLSGLRNMPVAERSASRWREPRLGPYLMVAPAVLLLLVLILAPVAIVAATAFSDW